MNPMRHVLGVLGVAAAGVLLAVSAAMNWRFGFQLGRTEFDGQIYGAASAAADCMKALVPFFFFAAVRNKVWSQAAASALVWVVVTAYSMTSALGHAALNRFDSTGHRAQAAQSYQDLRSELKRAEEQSGWIPQHRPYEAVQGAIEGLKAQAAWKWSNGCKDVSSKSEQKFCQQFAGLNSELASASAATEANTHLESIKAKIATMEGSPALSEADPQAKVLTELAVTFFPNVKIENVQMALTIFVALLLEVGSGFGMYVAFSQWRLYDVKAPAAPKMVAAVEDTAAAAVAAPVLTPAAVQSKKPRSGANDNKTIDIPVERPVAEPETFEAQIAEARTIVERQPEVRAIESSRSPAKLLVPENNTERFYRENVEVQDGSSVTSNDLYASYVDWCSTTKREPASVSSFGREFGQLGVKRDKSTGKTRYIGIALKSDLALEEATNKLLYRADAA
jgi:RFX DNA-binding domain